MNIPHLARRTGLSWLCLLLCLPPQIAFGASVVGDLLYIFPPTCDLGQISVSDAEIVLTNTPGGPALRVWTGHAQTWPGITLRAPAGHWDLSRRAEVVLEVANPGTNEVTVFCRVGNPGADGTSGCVTGSSTLAPGTAGSVRVALNRGSNDKLEGKLFGMRGYPVKAGGPGTVNPSNITQVLVFVSKPAVAHVFEVLRLTAAGRPTSPTAWVTDAEPFFPFLDTFGQYRHKSWPGKIESLEGLKRAREAEVRELSRRTGPADWDQYGGWRTGPERQATGFFRTEKIGRKWWLIDPDGHVFFSHGIDCVRMLDTTPIEERDDWWDSFPGRQPEFAEFFSTRHALKGHYAGRSPRCFSFAGANLLRKYGPDWKSAYPELIQRRLRSWGLNTIANWSDEQTRLLRRTPYTDTIGSGRTRMLEGSEGYWGKFPDVFDPSFSASLAQQMASKKGKSAGDPWCLGYFSDNEMSWGDEVSLALGALKSPADQPAKLAFVSDLKQRYGEIQRLNDTWGTSCASWDALLAARETPDQSLARADLQAFYTRCAEQYFRTVREAIKQVAPHQLYLGCRFAWVNDRAAAAAAKYCDVVSYNLYRRSVAEFQFNGGADVPLIIGEFHFGALDRGMFHTGLVPVATQQARAEAYRDYVRGALRHPQFVGCHWFQYMDEPVTGRVYDEENYQIGFVDVADTPYAETITASRDVGYHLYTIRDTGQ